MTIRLTGMNSGLDTDAIIQELVSAYRVKGDKIKKQQTKLSWTQDKWKALNAKVLNLYKSLDKMRFTAGYNMKKTTVSNTSKATVTAAQNAVNGTQSLNIESLAKGGYLTGGKITDAKSGSTKLSDLGFTGEDATFRISGNGVTKDLTIGSNETISQFVKKINDSGTGVTASYDNTNKRIYITSSATGKDKDFMLTATNTEGAQALNALGVNVASKTASAEAEAWMKYYVGGTVSDGTFDTSSLKQAIREIVEEREKQAEAKGNIESLQDDNALLSQASKYIGAYQSNQSLIDDLTKQYKEKNKTASDPDPAISEQDVKADAKDLSQLVNMSKANREKKYVREYDENDNTKWTLRVAKDTDDPDDIISYSKLVEKYDIEETQDKLDDKNDPVLDKDGNHVQETSDILKQIKSYNSNQKVVDSYEIGYEDPTLDANGPTADDINSMPISTDRAITIWKVKNSADLEQLKKDYDQGITNNKTAIEAENKKYEESEKNIQKHKVIDSSILTADFSTDESNGVFQNYVNELAKKVDFFAHNYEKVGDEYKFKDDALVNKDGRKVDATDATIWLNGVEYTSNTNSFNINGLTIDVHETTGMSEDDAITLTTETDTQGLYDKIKDFITEYNAIVSEMSSLYNAESSKGYEPLTAEEKEALSESDIADWEKKIKDSLLRRDSTLGSLLTGMTSAMSTSVTVNGKKYSLASLGIKTGNYFGTTAATRYMFHIDGDADDDETSANADKLMAMLKSDPNTVIEIMKGASQKLYESLNKRMESTSLSSFQSIYNDKSMAQSYSDYTKKITAWEEKVASIEDSYYKKFAAMETALAKLQSQQSALAGLLGS